jgi:hypothetical protein
MLGLLREGKDSMYMLSTAMGRRTGAHGLLHKVGFDWGFRVPAHFLCAALMCRGEVVAKLGLLAWSSHLVPCSSAWPLARQDACLCVSGVCRRGSESESSNLEASFQKTSIGIIIKSSA